jgi:hypothetical protein
MMVFVAQAEVALTLLASATRQTIQRARSVRRIAQAHGRHVPVCRLHHRELHRYGDEASWWAGINIDPAPIALELWRRTRPDTARGPNSLESPRVSDVVEAQSQILPDTSRQ